MSRTPWRVLELENPVQAYAWGSRTAIPGLLGQPPSTTPVAELWMGAHPKAPSRVRIDGQPVGLDALIARDPEAFLGPETARRFHGQLPFLFKILAAREVLSIQAHPSQAQAQEGFARENALGLPLDAPHRNYRDPHHKPELILALSPFWGVNGFRAPADIHAWIVKLCPRSLGGLAAGMRREPEAETLKGFYRGLMGLDAGQRREALAEALAHAAPQADQDPVCRWVVDIQRQYPQDLGALAPAYLHLVRLEPGEAMYLPAGQLHAYLQGVGLEIMANSDNVLRGGLTGKHVDLPELLKVLRFDAAPPRRVPATPAAAGETVFPTPAAEFLLARLEPRPGCDFQAPAERGPEILLCLEGQACLEVYGDSAGGLRLTPGTAVFVPAALPRYRLAGDARLYRAGVPAL